MRDQRLSRRQVLAQTAGGLGAIALQALLGLGTENRNLPAFIALENGAATIQTRAYSSAWLPPVFSGTKMVASPEAPMFDIQRPKDLSAAGQASLLETIHGLNRAQKARYPLDQDLEARSKLRARRSDAGRCHAGGGSDQRDGRYPQALRTRGSGGGSVRGNCLLARRLVESGVRFVTIISASGGGTDWDTHNNIRESLPKLGHSIDQGLFGLISDLKSRGMFEDTLVVWSGEFGRLPTIEAENQRPGRDHNPYGFTMWMPARGWSPARTMV